MNICRVSARASRLVLTISVPAVRNVAELQAIKTWTSQLNQPFHLPYNS